MSSGELAHHHLNRRFLSWAFRTGFGLVPDFRPGGSQCRHSRQNTFMKVLVPKTFWTGFGLFGLVAGCSGLVEA